MAFPPRRGPADPVTQGVDEPQDFGAQDGGAATATEEPEIGGPPESSEPSEAPPLPEIPKDTTSSIFDAMDKVAANPPTPGEMQGLIDETDRIHALLADDPGPRPAVLDLKDEDLVTVFRGRLREAAMFRQPFERKWLKAFGDYNQNLEPHIDVWKSKIKLPYVRALVSAAIPSAVAAAFNSGTILRLKPQRPEHEKSAVSMEKLLQWQLTVKLPARKAFRHFLHYRTLYGTGILKTGWRRETKAMLVRTKVYDNVDELGQPLQEGQQGAFLGHAKKLQTVDIHDEPRLECVDLWNALPCPWTRLEHLPYFIERVETTREEVLAMARIGAMGEEAGLDKVGNVQTPEEAVKAWFEENPNFDTLDSSLEVAMTTRANALQSIGYKSPLDGQSAGDTEKEPGPNPCVMYRYTTHDVEVWFSGDGHARILGKQPAPLDIHDPPYIISQFDDVIPGLVWGCGIGMIAGPIQTQIDFDINHGNDGRRLAMNPILKVKTWGSSLMGDLTVRPGAQWKVQEQDDIEQLELHDLSQKAIEWIGTLVGFGDRATGIGDLQRGLGDSGIDTATEASIVDSNAITRRLVHSEEIRDVWMEVGRNLVSHNKQFFNKEQMIRVTGADGLSWSFEEISPESIWGEYDVVPGMSMTRSDVVLQRRDWLSHFQMFNGDPLTDQHELRRRYWKAFDQDDIDSLLAPMPPDPQDPMDEEILLNAGLGAPVSPDDDDRAHIQIHGQALMALRADPMPDTKAIAAHEHHLQQHQESMAQKTAMLLAGAQAQAAGGPPGTSSSAGTKDGAPQAGKVRDKATTLGQAQGSNGQGGKSPGPNNPPGRPTRKP